MDEEILESDKWASDLAGLFKGLETKEKIGATLGTVNSVEPLVISILDGMVILNSETHDIYISDSITKDYKRKIKIDGNIQFKDSNCGITVPAGACDTAGPHTHTIDSININTSNKQVGNIEFTDGLKKGDNVLVVADELDSSFFIIDRVTKV